MLFRSPSLLYEALFPAAIRRKWHSHGIAENECAMPPQTPGPQGFESKWHRWHSTFCNIGIYIITLRGKRYAFLLCHLCHFPCNRWAPALSRGIAETVCTVPPPGHLCHFSGTASSAPRSAAFPLPVGRKGGKVACRSATFLGKFQPPAQAAFQKKAAADEIRPRQPGAGNQTRTDDLLITNQLLYRLSYSSG